MPQTFESAQLAANVLVDAAEKFDVSALIRIVGTDDQDLVLTGEYAQDRERAQLFAAQARKKMHVAVDPKTAARAYLLVGAEDWPFRSPDGEARRSMVVRRPYRTPGADVPAYRQQRTGRHYDLRILCRSAIRLRLSSNAKGYTAPQFAQRIVSTAGKQDGLAWQKSDGTWDGPIGEQIALAIEHGYNLKDEPYHGYFFKVLKGQGPSAPLGTMDYVVKGVMIGGFALVAAPAEYGETGLKTFMVSNTGVVYEKDLGPNSLTDFQKLERFDPDKSWTAVAEHDAN